MMRFAADILNAMKIVTTDLETKLGPDTSDLDLRIGVHSGQVTAGVLRGERARLQLFGDTMVSTTWEWLVFSFSIRQAYLVFCPGRTLPLAWRVQASPVVSSCPKKPENWLLLPARGIGCESSRGFGIVDERKCRSVFLNRYLSL